MNGTRNTNKKGKRRNNQSRRKKQSSGSQRTKDCCKQVADATIIKALYNIQHPLGKQYTVPTSASAGTQVQLIKKEMCIPHTIGTKGHSWIVATLPTAYYHTQAGQSVCFTGQKNSLWMSATTSSYSHVTSPLLSTNYGTDVWNYYWDAGLGPISSPLYTTSTIDYNSKITSARIMITLKSTAPGVTTPATGVVRILLHPQGTAYRDEYQGVTPQVFSQHPLTRTIAVKLGETIVFDWDGRGANAVAPGCDGSFFLQPNFLNGVTNYFGSIGNIMINIDSQAGNVFDIQSVVNYQVGGKDAEGSNYAPVNHVAEVKIQDSHAGRPVAAGVRKNSDYVNHNFIGDAVKNLALNSFAEVRSHLTSIASSELTKIATSLI